MPQFVEYLLLKHTLCVDAYVLFRVPVLQTMPHLASNVKAIDVGKTWFIRPAVYALHIT